MEVWVDGYLICGCWIDLPIPTAATRGIYLVIMVSRGDANREGKGWETYQRPSRGFRLGPGVEPAGELR